MMSYPCERGLLVLLHRDVVLLAGNKTISDSFEVVSRSIVKILQRGGQTAAQLKKRNHRKILNKHQVMRILGVVCSVWSSTILKGIICFGKHSMNIISQLGTETNSLRFWCQIMHPFLRRAPIGETPSDLPNLWIPQHHLQQLQGPSPNITGKSTATNQLVHCSIQSSTTCSSTGNHLLKKMGMTGVVSCYMLFLVVYR